MQLAFTPRSLGFPSGIAPGVNRLHPASQNLLISCISRGGGFMNIGGGVYKGSAGAVNSGAPASVIYPGIGRAATYTNATDMAQFTNFPIITPVALTVAAMLVLIGASATNAGIVNTDNITTGWGIGVGASTGLLGPICDGSFGSAGFNAAVFGDPYFYCQVMQGNSNPITTRQVLVNLRKGTIDFGTTVGFATATIGAGLACVNIGNRAAAGSVGNTRQMNGAVAAAMMSLTAISTKEMAQWADDPWGFWYPNATNDVMSMDLVGAASGGGGSHIKFRKTLSQIGGRVGSRQPQGWGT